MTDELIKSIFDGMSEALSSATEALSSMSHHEIFPVTKVLKLSNVLGELVKKLGDGPESTKVKKVYEDFDKQRKLLLISTVDKVALTEKWRSSHPDEESPSEENLYLWGKSNDLIKSQ